jgi:hypothetical protein
VSGNPHGRPHKGESLTDLFREFLRGTEQIEIGKGKDKRVEQVTRREMFMRAVFKTAVRGNVAAQRLVWNYMDGLPPWNIGIEGKLVSLNVDMELSPEEQGAYDALLGQLFGRREGENGEGEDRGVLEQAGGQGGLRLPGGAERADLDLRGGGGQEPEQEDPEEHAGA